MSSEIKKKLLEQLDALKIFPNNKLVRGLRNQIKQKLEKLEKKKTTQSDNESRKTANLVRSGKLRKYHHYIRLIRDSFPNLKYSEIRKQLLERKQGKQVSIPDAVWQNPSP